MARGQSRSLVLEVSGKIDQFESSMRAVRATLHDAKLTSENFEKTFTDNWREMQGGLAASANEMEKQVNRMMRNIKRNMEEGLRSGDPLDIMKAFDIGGHEERIAALRATAVEARSMSENLRTVAVAQGDLTGTAGQLSAALLGNAAAADLEADQLERVVNELRPAVGAYQAAKGAADAHTTATQQATANANLQRIGLQQLSFQVADVGASYASGIKPMVIFAQQGTQVVQSLALMTGGAGRFGAFLTGPWGFALMGAASIAGILATELLNAEDASHELELTSNGLSDAQSVLGKMFDMVTGKIKANTAELRLNAAQMAINLRAQALSAESSARQGVTDAGQPSWGAVWRKNIPLRRAFDSGNTVASAKLQAILNEKDPERAGKLALDASRWAESAKGFENLDITRQEYMEAVARAAEVAGKRNTANLIDQSLANNELAPGLRETGRPTRERNPREDRSAERAAKEALDRKRGLEDAQLQADSSILGALLKRAQNEDQRLAIQLLQLDAERKSRDLALERQVADGDMQAADAEALKAKYKAVDQLEEEVLRGAARQKKLDDQFQAEEAAAAQQIDALRLQAQLADTLEERKAVAKQILDLEIKFREREARKLLNSEDPDDRALGQAILNTLPTVRAVGEKAIDEQYANELERYLAELQKAAADTDKAFMDIAGNGMRTLEDELVAVISGTESLGSAFKKMANQIIGDLVRIGIQKAILGGINGAGGGGGLLGGILGFVSLGGSGGPSQLSNPFGGLYAEGGMITGPGTGRSDSILARVSNGEFVVNAESTRRFLPLLEAINAGVPAFADGGMVGVPRLPTAASLRGYPEGPGGTVTIPITINAPGATAETVAMIRRELAEAAPTIVQAATANTMRQITRNRL